MAEDRIKSEITISYKASNSRGETTLEIKPLTIIVSDQSPASASAHLASIVGGILAPAQAQAK
jgi:hypothetical protein